MLLKDPEDYQVGPDEMQNAGDNTSSRDAKIQLKKHTDLCLTHINHPLTTDY